VDIEESQNSGRPISFFHIPKTAGTSVRVAIAPYFPAEDFIYGEITEEVLTEISPRLQDRVFIAGHWANNTLRFVPDEALKATVLRDTRDQAISNYLQVCRDDSDLGDFARRSGFRQFVQDQPHFLIYQTASLLAPQRAGADPVTADEAADNTDDALAFLNRLDFVGCTEASDDLALCLPHMLGLPEPLTLPRLNRATDHGTLRDTIRELHQTYDELRREPEYGRLISQERRLYYKALGLTRQREGMLHEIQRAAAPARGTTRPQRVLRFAAGDPAIRTEIGEKIDGVIRLRGRIGCGVYGPYLDLPMGRLTALIRLVGPRRGLVMMDVAADIGDTIVASRIIDLGSVRGDVLELSTVVPRPLWKCEIRLFCDRDAEADVAAVELRLGWY
jgi:hypothetical protein